ncbi:MAG: oligopeptide ABC transporter substrate-binding protein [Bacillota bacterium]|uniref:oligopeptide ABC transporter substrate-binding protein n=1 Tax=Virgibacillus TaxID=84406 RepID=UPI00041BC4D8|nr:MULTISPECIES: oligopeptide ABC transporter substrate-binding protein [Bacillaceae]MDY7044682.1 ABC transporter substrate-binding protein [Virgibacillus sp. M23]
MKKYWFSFMLLLMLTMLLVACSEEEGDKEKENNETQSEEGDKEEATGPVDGGTLVYALDSAPEGLFNINFYGIAVDAEVIDFLDDGLITYDEELKPQPNVADWKTEDNQHYTFTFQKGVKWHNGEELTVHDWVFAIETLAHPDYDGPRYTNVQTIKGVPEFKAGEADEIEGIHVVNDYEIEITFDKARVNNLENLWTYPLSRKEFEGIPVAEMSESPQVRQKPIGIGPFKVKEIIPGESIQFEAFDDYWQGKPHLDSIVLKVIDPSLVVGELENNQLDMTAFHPSNFESIQALDNTDVIRAPGLSYYYVGFRLGTWDGEKNVMDYEKYHDKQLRKAMAYAIDRESWINEFFFGLGQPVNRPIPTAHWISADDSDVTVYNYDPEKAKELLDEAGYVDVNDDGIREDPNGEEFKVKFSHYATQNPTFEARAKALTQYWNDVGLATKLEMPEANLYYEQLEEADESMEVFFGGWSTGTDPDPTALWGSDQLWNYPRWVNEKNDQLLADAIDINVVGQDQEKRKQIYMEWQKNVSEEVPMITIAELEEVMAVNTRVQGVEMDVSGLNSSHEWWIKPN